MKLRRNLLNLLLLLGVIIFTTGVFSSCNSSGAVADVTVWYLSPRAHFEGILEPEPYVWKVDFHIEIKPNHAVNGEFYVLLLSHDGYLYDWASIAWNEQDFATPDPNERDISKINEIKGRSTRLVTLSASASDKDISPLINDFNQFYLNLADQAQRHGQFTVGTPLTMVNLGSYEPNESDYNRIANNYVTVTVVDEKGLEKLLNH